MAQNFAFYPRAFPEVAILASQLHIYYDYQLESDLRWILNRAAMHGLPFEGAGMVYIVTNNFRLGNQIPAPNPQRLFDTNEADLRGLCREYMNLYRIRSFIRNSPIHIELAHIQEQANDLLDEITAEHNCLTYKIRARVAERYQIQVMASYYNLGLDVTLQEQILRSLEYLATRCPPGQCRGHGVARGANHQEADHQEEVHREEGHQQEGRRQEDRHDEDRHEEGLHEEGRHEEGRHEESRQEENPEEVDGQESDYLTPDDLSDGGDFSDGVLGAEYVNRRRNSA